MLKSILGIPGRAHRPFDTQSWPGRRDTAAKAVAWPEHIQWVSGEPAFPEDHMPHKAVCFLHGKQAVKRAFGQVVLAQGAEHKGLKARIPPPLKRVRAWRRFGIAVVGLEQLGIALTDIGTQQIFDPLAQLFIRHVCSLHLVPAGACCGPLWETSPSLRVALLRA